MWGSAGEDAADDFLEGDFLNVNVADGQFVQQGFADRDHAVALELALDAAGVLSGELGLGVEDLEIPVVSVEPAILEKSVSNAPGLGELLVSFRVPLWHTKSHASGPSTATRFPQLCAAGC